MLCGDHCHDDCITKLRNGLDILGHEFHPISLSGLSGNTTKYLFLIQRDVAAVVSMARIVNAAFVEGDQLPPAYCKPSSRGVVASTWRPTEATIGSVCSVFSSAQPRNVEILGI